MKIVSYKYNNFYLNTVLKSFCSKDANQEIIYDLGYNLSDIDEVLLGIDIYINGALSSGCGWGETEEDDYSFYIIVPDIKTKSFDLITIEDIDNMFIKLEDRLRINIPLDLKKEYTDLFLLYKLNNFMEV